MKKKAEDRRLKDERGTPPPFDKLRAGSGLPHEGGGAAKQTSAQTGNPGMGQRIDINVLFRRLGEKDFLLDQASQALGMAQQQCAAMDSRIKELEAELAKKADRPSPI